MSLILNFVLKKESLGGFENGGPNQGDRLLSGPDRGLCTSSCCFLLFSPCFYRARLVRDSWGLVQGMMTEQDSLSSPVHIPVACLPFPSAHPPHPLCSHVQVISPIPCPSACSSSPPTPLMRPETLHSLQCPGHTLILHPPSPLGEGSTHGIIPRLPKGDTEAREVGWENGEAESQPLCHPRCSPWALLSAPLSPLLFSSPEHRPSRSQG